MTEQFECETCNDWFDDDKLNNNGDCSNCAQINSMQPDWWEEDYHMQSNFKATVQCSECGDTFSVAGYVWEFRLKSARLNGFGHFIGWNCDRCADLIESGRGY